MALALPAAAAAGVHVTVDASGYPEVQGSVVGSAAASTPPRVLENGVPVVGLEAQNLGRTKAVVLALDRSRSMKGAAFADATTAARTFLRLKGRSDRVAVVAFGRRADALTDFAADPTDADAALASVAVDARQGTALYDGVSLAAERLAAQRLPGRVIVLLTDGQDVSSRATLEESVAAARRAHASVYPIAVAGAGYDPAPLQQLASETGGRFQRVGSSAALGAVYASIARELARTWRIGYTTAARPGETIRVGATLRGLGHGVTDLKIPAGLGTPAVPHARPSRLIPSVLYRPVGTFALAGAVALLMLLAAGLVLAANRGVRLRARLDAHVVPIAGTKRRQRSGPGLRARLYSATENAFGHLRQWKKLAGLLERADLPLRAAEFVYLQLGCAFGLGLVLAVTATGPFATLIGMVAGAAAPLVWVSLRARKRLKAFENQLPDLLITLAASLKAGHSFRQGIQTVVDEGQPPASAEFRRVLTETSLGRPMDDALQDMARRLGSTNFEFVVTAVTIQRQIGGSMAGLFDMVAEAVRNRQQFARKIKGLTAMGRLSAYVLIGLPFLLAATLTLMNRTYMHPLYATSTGHMLIVVGLISMAFGSAVLQKIVSFRG
ncbi:MAG TPA: VWA domain-containing protein [Gaiellaceae bacterium]|nr:VWA domain-containing protein [Gaiellaceae bacterium]